MSYWVLIFTNAGMPTSSEGGRKKTRNAMFLHFVLYSTIAMAIAVPMKVCRRRRWVLLSFAERFRWAISKFRWAISKSLSEISKSLSEIAQRNSAKLKWTLDQTLDRMFKRGALRIIAKLSKMVSATLSISRTWVTHRHLWSSLDVNLLS